jgi:hypothetical protein
MVRTHALIEKGRHCRLFLFSLRRLRGGRGRVC